MAGVSGAGSHRGEPSGGGFITPPPGLLPPVHSSGDVPERKHIPAVPGGLPLFTPSPGHVTGPTVPGALLPPLTAAQPAASAPAAPAAPAASEATVSTTRQVELPQSVSAPSWGLELPDGTSYALTSATFVGRNPTVSDAAPDAQLLPLADPAKSLSKTHALLVPQLDYVMVTDLHSTNGIATVAPNGAVTVLEPGRTSPVQSGSTLQLGSFTVTVSSAQASAS